MAPPGPATVLFGGDSWGLTSDPYPFEEEGGKLAVVGRNGAYRMLRYPDDGLRAGHDVRLSPDGNLVSSVDIAQDLLREGRFGGSVPAPAALPARWSVIAQGALCLLVPVLLATAVVVLMVRAVRRRRVAARV
ncbi:hypothetical protein AB0H83_14210 [Dactylosporangium sp. NPDC050688]|uniref:hypothetical protein n=1 Tax=Dactylosporangium sp. NPDC050688 TaxID=3157217 RepID=UPI0034029E9D